MSGTLLLCTAVLSGQQDSVLVDKDFRFVDGAYHSWTALLHNQPSYGLASLDGRLVLQAEQYLLKIENLHPKGRPELSFDLEKLPIICLDGLPYVRAYYDTVRQFTVYAGLRVRGQLSYFAYETPTQDTVLIKAYNPINGQPFRRHKIIKPGVQLQEFLLKLTTGQVWPYTLEHLLEAISDDPALVKSLTQLSPQQARERMQKVILIYDDRHPLYLPAVRGLDKE